MRREMANIKEENKELKAKLLSSQKHQEYFLQRIQEASTANENLSQSPIMPIESKTLQTEDQEVIPENGLVMKQDRKQANRPSDMNTFFRECKDVKNLTIQKKKMQQIKCTAANKMEKIRSYAREMQQKRKKKPSTMEEEQYFSRGQGRVGSHDVDNLTPHQIQILQIGWSW